MGRLKLLISARVDRGWISSCSSVSAWVTDNCLETMISFRWEFLIRIGRRRNWRQREQQEVIMISKCKYINDNPNILGRKKGFKFKKIVSCVILGVLWANAIQCFSGSVGLGLWREAIWTELCSLQGPGAVCCLFYSPGFTFPLCVRGCPGSSECSWGDECENKCCLVAQLLSCSVWKRACKNKEQGEGYLGICGTFTEGVWPEFSLQGLTIYTAIVSQGIKEEVLPTQVCVAAVFHLEKRMQGGEFRNKEARQKALW